MENAIIRHCAPTLAGLKTAGLFSCSYDNTDTLLHSIRAVNKRLRSKGLCLIPLRTSGSKALIYLYRPAMLCADLKDATALRILKEQGYHPENCRECVAQLARKLRRQEEFPHEIGLFLGYPAEDVCGFMEKGPNCCKCSGCWKVYGNEAEAQRKFALYKKCTRVYLDCRARGAELDRLTIAR